MVLLSRSWLISRGPRKTADKKSGLSKKMPTESTSSSASQWAGSASARLKPLPFAFPFVPRGQGHSQASAQFTDEHEIYRMLATRETGGGYLVSTAGLWHGGIHVTEGGIGQSLDLDKGLRCIADGVLIAFRANRTYAVSELAAAADSPAVHAPYSTGFALVQHTMEFPQGVKLTFYSLYMHLMSDDDYSNFPGREKPGYWPRVWVVTGSAKDRPATGPNGQIADPAQQGLRVRKTHPHGDIIGILPQGARVSIGNKKNGWGQLTDLHGASLYPRAAGGYADSSHAIGGWIFTGCENGGPVVRETIADLTFDRVVMPRNEDRSVTAQGVPMKAGELIGHLGRYDSLNRRTAGTRLAHIEVFCDDSILSFIEHGRAWINEHGAHKTDWTAVGLPWEPTMLRIEPGTMLYQRNPGNQFAPRADSLLEKTDAVQRYSLATLARTPQGRVKVDHPNPDPGYPVNWWRVHGVNALDRSVEGWVCDFNFPGGRVTREFAQKWIDFRCLADDHDAAHTIFATVEGWAAYQKDMSSADTAGRSKLSPLMLKVYDALFTRGNGELAADELCKLSQSVRGGYPWLMQAASRLIVKHESEWANPAKWKQLISVLENTPGEDGHAQQKAEQERIDKLVWWEEVKAGVPGFPEPEVFHINPIELVANFSPTKCILIGEAQELALTVTSGFEGATAMDFGAVTGNADGQGMSFGIIQWAAGQGTLSPVLDRMRRADPVAFQGAFGTSSNYPILESAVSGGRQHALLEWALDQQARNPAWKGAFKKLGEIPAFQKIQIEEATREYHAKVMTCLHFLRTISPELMAGIELVTYCALFDLVVQQGGLHRAARQIRERALADRPDSQGALVRIAVEERARTAAPGWVADCFSRRVGILLKKTFTYSANGHTASRTNPNFHLIPEDASAYVCGI